MGRAFVQQPLGERLLVTEVLRRRARVVIGRVGHVTDVLDEPVRHVETVRKRRFQAVADQLVGHDTADRLPEHRDEAELRCERK